MDMRDKHRKPEEIIGTTRATAQSTPRRVTVVDFDMSFGNMVAFFVKAALAAIPAAIIVTLIGVLIFGIFTGLLTGLRMR